MATEQPDESRDTKRLRALAHPLRWKLIDLLAAEPTATATRCAVVTGESVASCSYHLNLLAKYGFVAEAPGGQGREKPWKLTSRNQAFTGEGLGVKGRLAAEAAGEAFLDHELDAMRSRIRGKARESEEWRRATGMIAATTYLTAEEAAEIRAALHEIADRHQGRAEDPSARPAGAREVRLFLSTFAVPERPATD